MIPRFWIDDRCACDVTESYMDVIKAAVNLAGFSFSETGEKEKICRDDIVVVNEVLVAVRYLLAGYRRVVVWFQGIVPEESYLRHRCRLRRLILSHIEKYVLSRATLALFVSPEMLAHYEEKYRLALKEKSFIMPCFCKTKVNEEALCAEKSRGGFAYVGSLAKWQCFAQTATFYAAIERRAAYGTKLFVFTEDIEQARKILSRSGAVNYEISCKRGEELVQALAGIRYGFVLRDDDKVNRVATPTKLSVYAACGLIPIYSPVLSDFFRHAAPISYGIPVPLPAGESEMASVLDDMSLEPDPLVESACRRLFSDYYHAQAYRDMLAEKLKEVFGTAPEKPSLLITIGNTQTGGIPNALYALLREIHVFYRVTLLAADGGIRKEILPEDIAILEPDALLRATETPLWRIWTLPLSARLFRIFGAAFAKCFGKRLPFVWLSLRQRKRLPVFDAAVAFSQPTSDKSFCNISCELALFGCRAVRKIAFVHCDFKKYGANSAVNRRLYQRFDQICAVSEASAAAFLSCVPKASGRLSVVPNILDARRILFLSSVNMPCFLGAHRPIILSVGRLSPEKGQERCIPLMRRLWDEGFVFEWHIVGDGPCREAIARSIRENGLSDVVFLHAQTDNPYPYMAQADFLFHPSFHEGAPLVLSEAILLSLPVLSTDTCSARELVGDRGIVCGVTDAELYDALKTFLSEKSYAHFRRLSREESISLCEGRAGIAVHAFRASVEGKE